MLYQNFCANTNQNDTSEQFSRYVEPAAIAASKDDSSYCKDERNKANDENGKPEIYLKKGKWKSDSQSVNTCGNSHGQDNMKFVGIKTFFLGIPFFKLFVNHSDPQENQYDKCYPMVVFIDV